MRLAEHNTSFSMSQLNVAVPSHISSDCIRGDAIRSQWIQVPTLLILKIAQVAVNNQSQYAPDRDGRAYAKAHALIRIPDASCIVNRTREVQTVQGYISLTKRLTEPCS